MFKKTAIAFGLAIVTGSAFAASGMGASSDAGVGAGGARTSMSSGSLATQFHRLDTNNDGVLSPSEAQANPTVAKLYDSMDTGASIKTDPQAKKSDASIGGITLNQFQAGMQAASGGTAGPAVSGGQTYTVMKNGSHRMMSNSAAKAGNAMNRSQQSMQSAGQSMNNTASRMNQSAQNRMSGMHRNMQSQSDRMRNNMSGAPSQGGMMQNSANNGGMSTTTSTSSSVQTMPSTGNGNNQ